MEFIPQSRQVKVKHGQRLFEMDFPEDPVSSDEDKRNLALQARKSYMPRTLELFQWAWRRSTVPTIDLHPVWPRANPDWEIPSGCNGNHLSSNRRVTAHWEEAWANLDIPVERD